MEPGAIRTRTIAGGAAGNLTVTGINLGDRLLHVINRAAAGADLASEFTVTAANTINNTGGTNTTGFVLEVTWESYRGGRYDARIPADGGKYVPAG